MAKRPFVSLIGIIGIFTMVFYCDFIGHPLSSSPASFAGGSILLRSIPPNNLSPPLLRAVKEAMRSRNRKLVSTCGMGGCGGLADRAMGLAFVAALAILTDRQLVVHPSIMTNMGLPLNFTGAARYWFRSKCDEQTTLDSIHQLLNATEEVIYVTSICYQMSLWEGAFKDENPAAWPHLAELHNQCSLNYEDAYYCGAGILQQVEAFQRPLSEARHLVEGLEILLPKGNYTVIQIRAGGSDITIGNSTVKALAWDDGWGSKAPEMWIEAFRNLNYSDCKNSIAVVSDSSRVLAELRHAARDRIMISHCCNQPLHRDRTKRQEFFFQEVIDLMIMARSRRIVASAGHFVDLGRTWLGKEGPDLVRISDMTSIEAILGEIFRENQCLL